MLNDNAEKCRGCTIKHLSEVLVALKDTDTNEVIRNAYICGNLAHAANHFMHYSPAIADNIRTLRLDSINDDLSLALPVTEISQRLSGIIEAVAAYNEKPGETNNPVLGGERKASGCRCRRQK